MIKQLGNTYLLSTKNTSYAFSVMETGHLEHLHYGARLDAENDTEFDLLREKHGNPLGNVNVYDPEKGVMSLEDHCLEMSSLGTGDAREPFLELIYSDGNRSSDFLFEKAEIKEGITTLADLPSSYEDEGMVTELIVTLKDRYYPVRLELHYGVFYDRDVIVRWSRLINEGNDEVKILRLLSTQLDLHWDRANITHFHGSWANEMHRHDTLVTGGKFTVSSVCGTSSSRSNPFVIVGREGLTEESGECYGLNLVYSGNHVETLEVTENCKTRFVSGINPQGFTYILEGGESFESPQAVMTYSNTGLTSMSHRLHDYVRHCIVRGKYKKALRPVLLNSWEANYFDITEHKLIGLAKAAESVGVELFVMDDGWFGNRNTDKSSLGDWIVNKKKLPHGLKGISDKIHEMGMQFGIWIEPEMVNVDSDLYRQHPDWVIDVPEHRHVEGRNQRILDFCNPEVVDYITEAISLILSSARIEYVKWDMNRTFTDYYSRYLEPSKQGEVSYRYILGVYSLARRLTEKFPDILFEGCASGGNRFDLGMMCFFPQIWASDNTDAIFRAEEQTNISLGYPLSVCGAHVSSCPNHQTLRVTPLTTRFNIASLGMLGYELNLCDMKKKDLDEVREEIAIYKKWRDVLQYGRLYRGRQDNIREWTVVSEDGERAVSIILQNLVRPNNQYLQARPKGLNKDYNYRFYNRALNYDLMDFGDLVNTASPIHVKQESHMHYLLSKFVPMSGEKEEYSAKGSVFMGGISLKSAFGGTGYNEETRHFPDFASRMYFIERI